MRFAGMKYIVWILVVLLVLFIFYQMITLEAGTAWRPVWLAR
jgi:hypothetical protein